MRRVLAWGSLWLGLVLFVRGSDPENLWVGRFSSLIPTELLEEWEDWSFSKVPNKTRYDLIQVDGRTVLKADSKRSASALLRKLEVNVDKFPYLKWSWRTEGPSGEESNQEDVDDFPLRLFVLFEQKRGPLDFLSRLTGKFGGRALNYVWDLNPAVVEDYSASPATDRVKMLAVQEGDARFGTWVDVWRDVGADHRKAFGSEPGKVVGVALMSDTDDTQGQCVSYYGDISFESLMPAKKQIVNSTE